MYVNIKQLRLFQNCTVYTSRNPVLPSVTTGYRDSAGVLGRAQLGRAQCRLQCAEDTRGSLQYAPTAHSGVYVQWLTIIGNGNDNMY